MVTMSTFLQAGAQPTTLVTCWHQDTQLKELDRLAELGVYETADLQVALGNKRVQTRSGLDHRERDGIRARFVAREFKGDETMYDVFAPSSTPSTGRISDYLRLKKACHTFAADVTNAYFRVGEDAECFVDPPTEWLDQQGCIGESDLCAVAKTAV